MSLFDSGPGRATAKASLYYGKGRLRSCETAVFFTYQELDQKFGRAQFLALNSELELFDVFPYDYRGQQARGYRLKPDHSESPAQHAQAYMDPRR